MQDEPYKRCSKCGETQPIGQFYRDASTKDGRTGWCAGCYRVSKGLARAHAPEPIPARAGDLPSSYFAGFFDADGSVGISPSRDTSIFLLGVIVSQVDPRPLYEFKKRYRGKVIGPMARGDNSRPIFQWGCQSQRAEDFLRDICPWLIVKRERVELALEFRELFKGDNTLPRGSRMEAPEQRVKRDTVIARRSECYERMRVLNKRGLT